MLCLPLLGRRFLMAPFRGAFCFKELYLDRWAVFVDAGYLLAAGGSLCCGAINRSEMSCHYKDLVSSLASFVTSHSGNPVLRVYWYDGAQHAVPTNDHLQIAELPHVKLRLEVEPISK